MIVATSNKGKIEEIKEILGVEGLYSLKDLNSTIDVVEDANTFYGNAAKKAKEIYDVFHDVTLADDSGLCIEGLAGFPGVETHRFLGPDATDRDRNLALIEKTPQDNRKATVVCTIVYYDGENFISAEGIIEGTITTSPRGENGFGFDEIFELPNGKTLAELTKEEKNEISARRIALNLLKQKLESHNKSYIKSTN